MTQGQTQPLPHTECKMNESGPEAHVYEAIVPVPKTLINLEESKDKNITYGPIHAVCK